MVILLMIKFHTHEQGKFTRRHAPINRKFPVFGIPCDILGILGGVEDWVCFAKLL